VQELQIRSNLLSPPCGTGARSPRAPAAAPGGIAMAYKLIEAAQSRWRAVNAPHLVAFVRAGTQFKNGKLVERSDDQQAVTPSVETAA
jgi:hypothetical protein